MSTLSVPAHFDGNQIILDKQVSIPENSQLIVTIVKDIDSERESFLNMACSALADSYDEVEYTLSDCK